MDFRLAPDVSTVLCIKLNINCDDGNFLKTNTRTPLLRNSNLESALRNQRSHCQADMTSN